LLRFEPGFKQNRPQKPSVARTRPPSSG
jgi:hypothetical protein